jgi:D-amino-acid dehydrogenase
MHVCVIGAGVVGLTTAYFLQAEGHSVTVVDREEGGREAIEATGLEVASLALASEIVARM